MPVSPLGHRQLFLTAYVEAVRQAHEVGGLVARELGARKAAEDRQAQDTNSIRDVVGSEGLKLRERENEGHGTGGGRQEGAPEETSEDEGKAGTADGSLDLLA